MVIKSIQTVKFKKVRKQAVNAIVLLCIFLMSSCKNTKNFSSKKQEENCIKYTLNYSEKIDSLTQDTVFIHGITRECSSNKILKGVDITIYDENKKEIKNVSSDINGKFSFKIKLGYYYIIAYRSGNHLQTPITYFGDSGNILEMNMYLASHPVLIYEINDPKLGKEIEKLKKGLKAK